MRILVYNVENLFLYMDRYEGDGTDLASMREMDWQRLSRSRVRNKSLVQTQWLARIIQTLDPDILMLCEVGGPESLQNFNRYFLGERYTPWIVEGNSDRGIDVGYLTKNELSFSFHFRSHRERSLGFFYPHEQLSIQTGYASAEHPIHPHRFSRDVAELRVTTVNGDLILFLVHLKSKLDNAHIDPLGIDRRSAEFKTLLQIYLERLHETEGKIPMLIGGDFNGIAAQQQTDPEFADLYTHSDLRDVLDIINVPLEQRYTHVMTGRPYHRIMNQIDYLFASSALQPAIRDAYIYRYTNRKGAQILEPLTRAERKMLPSDHYPLVCELDLSKVQFPAK